MKIIYEDAYLLVLDKPAGLPVLPDGWEKDAPYLVKMRRDGLRPRCRDAPDTQYPI